MEKGSNTSSKTASVVLLEDVSIVKCAWSPGSSAALAVELAPTRPVAAHALCLST